MAKALFIPINIIAGIVAGFIGRKIFDQVWTLIDEEDPPEADDRDATLGKLLAAAALQGAVFAVAKTATRRGSRRAFANLTGTWPGGPEPGAG